MVINKQSYSFVLWAVPRFHRSGSARMTAMAPSDTVAEPPISGRPSLNEDEKAVVTVLSDSAEKRSPGPLNYAIS
jgi:hypothetical protein